MTPTRFADVAAQPAENGYRPVPIKPRTKRPPMDEWQHYTFDADEAAQYADCGCGVKCGADMAPDIDVDDEEVTQRIVNALYAVHGIGDSSALPERIGRHPRVLIPLRVAAPLRKMVSASYKLRSNDSIARVEILADGQQFVAYHVHPDTGRPYVWNGAGDLLTVAHDALCETDAPKLRAFLAATDEILAEYGERIGEATTAPNAPGVGIPCGGRNDALYAFGCKLARARCTQEEIAAALLARNAQCVPPLPEREVLTTAHSAAKQIPAAAFAGWPQPMDLPALAQVQAATPRFVMPDWMPEGYATLLAGHGGVGKSGIALHLSVCIALGRRFWGVECAQRRVLYLSCEDRESLLHWRLSRVCAHEGIGIADLAGKLDVLDLVGSTSTLWLPEAARGEDASAPTFAYSELVERVEATQRQVIVVDGISDTFGGNENDRAQVKRFVNALLHPVPIDGALLLVGHVAKPAAMNGATSEGYSGSTGWHNAVRARWYLYPETEPGEEGQQPQRTGRLALDVQKANLSRSNQTLTFEWNADKHLYAAVGNYGGQASDLVASIEARRDEHIVMRLLAAAEDAGDPVHSGEHATRNAALRFAAEGTLPAAFRGKPGKRRLFMLLVRLKHDALLIEEAGWSPARNRVGLWRVTGAGRSECGAPQRAEPISAPNAQPNDAPHD